MFATDIPHNEILWNRLQEPIYPAQLPQDYLLLLAALDTGWQIKAPVRLVQIGDRADDHTYLFNLSHKLLNHIVQLAIPAGPVIENFLCEEGLMVLVNDTAYAVLQPGLVC